MHAPTLRNTPGTIPHHPPGRELSALTHTRGSGGPSQPPDEGQSPLHPACPSNPQRPGLEKGSLGRGGPNVSPAHTHTPQQTPKSQSGLKHGWPGPQDSATACTVLPSPLSFLCPPSSPSSLFSLLSPPHILPSAPSPSCLPLFPLHTLSCPPSSPFSFLPVLLISLLPVSPPPPHTPPFSLISLLSILPLSPPPSSSPILPLPFLPQCWCLCGVGCAWPPPR